MKWAFGVVLVAECVTDVVEKKKINHLLHKKSQAVIIYSTRQLLSFTYHRGKKKKEEKVDLLICLHFRSRKHIARIA